MNHAMPTNLTPREACAAALAIMLHLPHGDRINTVLEILEPNGCVVKLGYAPGGVGCTARLRVSQRRAYEATAGCGVDALMLVLQDALGAKEEAHG